MSGVLTLVRPNWHPSHAAICQSPTPTPRPAHQILLPAVYDRIALAVNLKSKHMGRREVPGAGEEGQASGKFQTFLLVPRCKNLGHVYFNVSSKASSFLPRDGELNDSSASTPYPPVLETHIWDPPTTQRWTTQEQCLAAHLFSTCSGVDRGWHSVQCWWFLGNTGYVYLNWTSYNHLFLVSREFNGSG